MKGKFRKLVPG